MWHKHLSVPVTFSIRKYRHQDFELLYTIDQACYQPAIAYSRRDLRNYLHFPGADCLVAETDSQTAGFILTAHDDRWGYIITIDVLEAHRRHGVGTMMLREAERALAATGVREVRLETATNNASAIAFWKKHGYRTRGVIRGYYPGPVDALSMNKTL
jgi:ribosomal protein S18 acetylase RimI-like enzyme